ncbi:hypothetical protein FF38_08705 [Lucilia cuprina]|uniref:Uncharacterized protein n=1 Tax=Lucilia cuprina TaxID=7375 RepID=A0A0L0C0J2_LUCCU|nr:hypothetical protein FF38_08705 [Lucilia cuprina]
MKVIDFKSNTKFPTLQLEFFQGSNYFQQHVVNRRNAIKNGHDRNDDVDDENDGDDGGGDDDDRPVADHQLLLLHQYHHVLDHLHRLHEHDAPHHLPLRRQSHQHRLHHDDANDVADCVPPLQHHNFAIHLNAVTVTKIVIYTERNHLPLTEASMATEQLSTRPKPDHRLLFPNSPPPWAFHHNSEESHALNPLLNFCTIEWPSIEQHHAFY